MLGYRKNLQKSEHIRPKKLPGVFAIDEFKGNTGNEKYQTIITDPASKRVLDILPCRSQGELITYLKQWNTKERKRVKYFVSDMWQPVRLYNKCWGIEKYLQKKRAYLLQILYNGIEN